MIYSQVCVERPPKKEINHGLCAQSAIIHLVEKNYLQLASHDKFINKKSGLSNDFCSLGGLYSQVTVNIYLTEKAIFTSFC